MKKIYNYRNCDITIIVPNTSSDNIRKSTESFLKKVLKERAQNGNSN